LACHQGESAELATASTAHILCSALKSHPSDVVILSRRIAEHFQRRGLNPSTKYLIVSLLRDLACHQGKSAELATASEHFQRRGRAKAQSKI